MVEMSGVAWCWGGQQAQNGDTCQAALLFRRVCSHFCFHLSPWWSCWSSQTRAGSFSDLVDLPLIPCLAAWRLWIREAGQIGEVGWSGTRAWKPRSPWWIEVAQKCFFMILFSLLPKRIFHIFSLGFDIVGHTHFHFEGRGIRYQRGKA